MRSSQLSDKPYAVVEFKNHGNMLGVALTAWITEDGENTAWPKKEDNASSWLKTKRVVKSTADLKRNWVMEAITIVCFAGKYNIIDVVYVCNEFAVYV